MKKYELLVILPGTLAETEVATEVEKVKAMLESNGATELEIGENEKRRLAYPVKHIRYGYFQLFYFSAETAQIKVIENKLRLMSELLRGLVQEYKGKSEKKINFGALAMGEDGKRSETETVREEVAPVAAVMPEEKVEAPVVSEEQQKLEAAPVKKASAKKEDKKKINLDEIDKKLDEILDIGLDNV